MNADKIVILAGGYGLAMVLGAVVMQFVFGVAPCEMCFWQRYPHIVAAVLGLGGFALSTFSPSVKKFLPALAMLALLFIATSGLIGAYHSGVEWKIFPGPSSCTGARVVFSGKIDLTAPSVVRCDIVSWRFLGLFSLANLNALFSLGWAVLGTVLLWHPGLIAGLLARRRGG
ncbi:MAG: disulfide bond formation protein B [Rhizomicrobium sp.]